MTEKDNSTPNAIEIEGKEIQKIIYKGEPVVTLAMVDEFHGRPEGTAKRNFIENKDKLILGEDYFEVPYVTYERILAVRISYRQDSLKRNMTKSEHGCHRGNIVMLTMTGYMMLVKSFTDDLAWKIQRKLVTHYFNRETPLLLQSGKTRDEMMDDLKATLKVLKMDKDIENMAKLIAGKVLDGEEPIDDYESVPFIKGAVSSVMEKDSRFKQMSLF